MKLLCPKCEKALEDHEDGHCPKALSRRFFLGALGSAFASAALAKVLPNVEIATPANEQLIAVATPRVHRAASIVLEHNGGMIDRFSPTVKSLCEQVEMIAAKTGRSAMAKVDGEIVHFVDPIKERKVKAVGQSS